MRSEFTAVCERDGDGIIAWCPEVPGANGQRRTRDEARESLAAAIALILEDRREEGLRGAPNAQMPNGRSVPRDLFIPIELADEVKAAPLRAS